MILLFVCVLNVFCFDIKDYDLISFQYAGPYLYFFRNNLFTFNGGVAVPNASLSGEDDCSVLNYRISEYFCYGETEKTVYSALPNGSDGILITSKGPESVVSYIHVVCDEETFVADATFVDSVNFSAVVKTPFGCKGSGPGSGPGLLCADESCCNSLSHNICLVSGSCYEKSGLCVYDDCFNWGPDDSHRCPAGCVVRSFHEGDVFTNGTRYYYDTDWCVNSAANAKANVCFAVTETGGDCNYVSECQLQSLKEGDFCVLNGVFDKHE